MPDLIDELMISRETPESIKARLLADTNAGVDPNDSSYADTIPGSFWDDLNGSATLEYDRVYDRLNEVVAAAIPGLSFGAFLDAWAATLGMERKAAAPAGGVVVFTGTNGTVIPAGARVSTAQTDEGSEPVEFTTLAGGTIAGGTVQLDVVAVLAGSAGNVPAATVTILDTEIVGVTVSNPAAMTGGADVETDEALGKRVGRRLGGAANGGNADQYVDWALAYPGVGHATVQPNTPGLGQVLVMITDENNDPMPVAAINGLQAQLDPSATPTQGAGLAPIGATVDVDTPVTDPVIVVASIDLEPGYSLTGAAGTTNVRPAIEESLRRYINGLPVGGDVIRAKVIAAIVDVAGVIDVTALTLDGGAGNVVIAANAVAEMAANPALTEV